MENPINSTIAPSRSNLDCQGVQSYKSSNDRSRMNKMANYVASCQEVSSFELQKMMEKLNINSESVADISFTAFTMPLLEGTPEQIICFLQEWTVSMERYLESLLELLRCDYNVFWSTIIYSSGIKSGLQSFLEVIPRPYEPDFKLFTTNELISPLYSQIYKTVFKIFVRIFSYKEHKDVSGSVWSGFLRKSSFVQITTLLELCSVYEAKGCNQILPKMMENVFTYIPKMEDTVEKLVSTLIAKLRQMAEELGLQISKSNVENHWDEDWYKDFIHFELDMIFSCLKLNRACSQISKIFLEYDDRSFLLALSECYETTIKMLSDVNNQLPGLVCDIESLRLHCLCLFRYIIYEPTLAIAQSSNDPNLDLFFDALTNCLHVNMLVHDYEILFPFRDDMQELFKKGIYVDDTRIEYMANGISACFQACGENYAVENIVVDPLYDPNFDRQLLGACSVEIGAEEMKSLVSNVKDLLPDLPDPYVEAVVKHYSYNSEAAINALLENSVPARLEKYKNEEYLSLQSASSSKSNTLKRQFIYNTLPSTSSTQSIGKSLEKVNQPSKANSDETFAFGCSDLNEKQAISDKIYEYLAGHNVGKESKPKETSTAASDAYLDESLLPQYNDNEYEDEYDDTYDEAGVGVREPDNVDLETKPLNAKLNKFEAQEIEDDSEDIGESEQKDLFVRNPEEVRAEMARKREQRNFQRRGNSHCPNNTQNARNVAGKPKGQGQEKDVLYNRRLKEQHKNTSGNHNRRKRADNKRREF